MRIVPHKRNRSTRGEPGETWRTKLWTEARRLMRSEDLGRARERAAQDRQEKAKSREAYVQREA